MADSNPRSSVPMAETMTTTYTTPPGVGVNFMITIFGDLEFFVKILAT
jgi:hypothetical protein